MDMDRITAIDFISTVQRMCRTYKHEETYCMDDKGGHCPFAKQIGGGDAEQCMIMDNDMTREEINGVRAKMRYWAMDNPNYSIKDEFINKYPDAQMNELTDTPADICPFHLGLELHEPNDICTRYDICTECDDDIAACRECWNRTPHELAKSKAEQKKKKEEGMRVTQQ